MGKQNKYSHTKKTYASRVAPSKVLVENNPALLPGAGVTVFIILCVAFFLKMIYLYCSKNSPFFEPIVLDPQYYHQWALRITRGDFGHEVFYGLPLYPFFLALCYSLSSASIYFVKIIQSSLGLVTLYFVFQTARLLGGNRAGYAAMLLGLFYGPMMFYEQVFIPEVLALPLYSLALYWICVLWVRRDAISALAAGAVCGLATLTKAGAMASVFVLFILMILKSKKSTCIFLLAFACMIAPVTLHNWVHGKDFVLLTSHSGFNFYIGNNEKSEGVYMVPEGSGSNVDAQIQDSKAIAEAALGRPLKPSEVSRYWSAKAKEFIRDNPSRFLWLCWRKLLLFFDGREISDVEDYALGKEFNPMLQWPWLNFYWLAPLALLGLFYLWMCRRYRLVLAVWLGAYMAGLIGFFINGRYRLPLLSLFLVLGGFALIKFWDMMREKKMMGLVLSVLILASAVRLTHLRFVEQDLSRDYVNAGDGYLEKDSLVEAIRYYQKALAVNPLSAKANLAMGLAMAKQGKEDEAREYYQKCLDLDPTNSQAFNNLGMWYEKNGRSQEAMQYFQKAIELKSNSFQAHNNLGMIYGKAGDFLRAEEEFKTALIINPKSARAHTNLGLIYYKQGRKDEAIKYWQKAIEIDPDFPEAKRALSLSEKSS